jgi:uncharacterized protein (DUF58 family)
MKFSREGKRFFLAAVLIGIAAFNTGNNLIYLILSMMLALFVLSVLILRINMKKLVVKLFQAGPVFANNSSDITLSVKNLKSFPSYSIKILQSGARDSGIYFPTVPAWSDASGTVSMVFQKRGIYSQGDFSLESGFPFIFLTKELTCKGEGAILVYPELEDIEHIFPDFTTHTYENTRTFSRSGDEFAMIREFRYGDDRRKIHWKASAKAEKLLVMEYAASEVKQITIILDNMLPQDAELFENAVSFSASVSEKFLRDEYFVRLLTCGKVIPFGSGREHLYKILDLLAIIERRDSWECPVSEGNEGMTLLILGSGDSPLRKFIPQSDMVFHAETL